MLRDDMVLSESSMDNGTSLSRERCRFRDASEMLVFWSFPRTDIRDKSRAWSAGLVHCQLLGSSSKGGKVEVERSRLYGHRP